MGSCFIWTICCWWENLTGNCDSERYIDFCVANFVKNLKRSILKRVEQFEFQSKLYCEGKFSFVSSNRTKYQIFLGLSQTRIYLVDSEQKAIHWQKSSTVGTSDDYPNRCFHKSVGSTLNLNRGVNGRNMKRNTT